MTLTHKLFTDKASTEITRDQLSNMHALQKQNVQ